MYAYSPTSNSSKMLLLPSKAKGYLLKKICLVCASVCVCMHAHVYVHKHACVVGWKLFFFFFLIEENSILFALI